MKPGDKWLRSDGHTMRFLHQKSCKCCWAFIDVNGKAIVYSADGTDAHSRAAGRAIIRRATADVATPEVGDVITERLYADRVAACRAAAAMPVQKPVVVPIKFKGGQRAPLDNMHEFQTSLFPSEFRLAIRLQLRKGMECCQNDEHAATAFLSGVLADLEAVERELRDKKPTRAQILAKVFGV